MVYITVQIPEGDVNEVEALVSRRLYLNRSDGIRDLIRKGLQIMKPQIAQVNI